MSCINNGEVVMLLGETTPQAVTSQRRSPHIARVNGQSQSWLKSAYTLAAVCTFVFVALVLLWGLSDETKDDFLIQFYSLDFDGAPMCYHAWSNVFWMSMICVLQKIIPIFAWHYFLQLILVLYTIWCVNVLIVEHSPKKVIGVFLCLALDVATYANLINSFNYTKIAWFLMGSSVLMLCSERIFFKASGVVLFAFGTLLRFDCIYLIVGFAVVCIFYSVVFKDFRNDRRMTIPLLLAIVLSFSLNFVSETIVDHNEAWKTYRQANSIMVDIYDYPLTSYKDDIQGWQDLGISENDYKMMVTNRSHNSDYEQLSSETYGKIIEAHSQKWQTRIGKKDILAKAKNTYKHLSFYPVAFLFAITACILFLFGNWKCKLAVFTYSAVIFAYRLFFTIMGREKTHVESGLYYFAFAFLIVFAIRHFEFSLKSAWKTVILCLSSLLLISFSAAKIKPRTIDVEARAVFSYFENNPSQLFVYNACVQEHTCINNLLFQKEYYNTLNSYYITQMSCSPHLISKLEHLNVSNIYADAADSDVIRFVSEKPIDTIVQYISEHYCENVESEIEKEINGRYIYKIVKTE